MKINVENILSVQAKEFIKDADFAYDDYNDKLNYDTAHMIAQKTLLRVNVLDSFLNNIVANNDIQKSSNLLTKKMLKQTQEDVDYMYPNDTMESDNCHVVMQLLKRTGEDMSAFLECFEQKHEVQSKIDIVQILKEQFKEYNEDIDYAYPNNNYNNDNAHIVLQGLLGKSEFLYQVLDNAQTSNDEEKVFKNMYLDKMSGLIELLNSAYSQDGYYLNNGHDIFSELIEGLKVEINDIQNIRLSSDEQIEKTKTLDEQSVITNSKVSNDKTVADNVIEEQTKSSLNVEYHSSNNNVVDTDKNINGNTNIDNNEQTEKTVRSEEVKKKFKSIM